MLAFHQGPRALLRPCCCVAWTSWCWFPPPPASEWGTQILPAPHQLGKATW